MLEKDFSKKEITPWLKAQGFYYFKPRGGPYSSRKGIPDYILCIQGCYIGLEIKTAKGHLTPNQIREGQSIRDAGGDYHIVRPENWKAVRFALLKKAIEWEADKC